MGRALAALLACATGSGVLASSPAAAQFAPADRSGARLNVPAAELKASLRCTADVAAGARTPVLLVPPTLADPDEAFIGYERAFRDLAIPYCTVTIPHHTTIDIQISAQYVVHAVRRMHDVTGTRVQLLGWSQGAGPIPRWALRFWPDIRPMVEELVGLEAPNHGAALARAFGQPALRQQSDNTQFITALNSRQETFPDIAYTNVYSRTSQFVQPNLDDTGTTSLHGGGGQIANIATQDICPSNAADHLAYWYDPVAYALTIDAISHPGPADPARIDGSAVCQSASMPYVAPATVPFYGAHLYNLLFVDRVNTTPKTDAEPPPACYVTARCAPVRNVAAALRLAATRSSSNGRCAVRLRMAGADLGLVESARFALDGQPVATLLAPPYETSIGSRTGARSHRVAARLRLADGRLLTVRRRLAACRASR